MQVRSFTQLAFDHPEYIVAAHLNVSLMDQQTVAALVAHFRIKRKSMDSVLRMQNVGSQFRVGRRGRVGLICHVVDYDPGGIQPAELQDIVEKIVKQSDQKTVIVGEGFLLRFKGRVDPQYSFDLLCRYLRRFEFAGIMYEPPSLFAEDEAPALEERVTNTRMFISHGQVDATVAPALHQLASNQVK